MTDWTRNANTVCALYILEAARASKCGVKLTMALRFIPISFVPGPQLPRSFRFPRRQRLEAR